MFLSDHLPPRIEAIKTLKRIKQLKIIVALRTDLLARVYEKTRASGFQPEKYEDLNFRVEWDRQSLKSLVDKRISLLIKNRYIGKDLTFSDVMPNTIGSKDSFDYIVQRTLMRPRDIIDYINKILGASKGRDEITFNVIRNVEGKYSSGRAGALFAEWQEDFPFLEDATEILRNRPDRFLISDISKEDVERICICILENADERKMYCPIYKISDDLLSGKLHYTKFRSRLIPILFLCGIIGARNHSMERTIFSFQGDEVLREKDCDPEMRISIHPMFWGHLGVMKNRRNLVFVSDNE